MRLKIFSLIIKFANWLAKFRFVSHLSSKIGVFFLGPIVLGIFSAPILVDLTIKRYVTFIVLVLAWQIASREGLRLQQNRAMRLQEIKSGNKNPPPGAGWFALIWFIAISLIAVFSLEAFRSYFGEEIFYCVLALITLGISIRVLEQGFRLPRPMPLLSLSVRWVYWSGIGLLSYYSLSQELPDPAIVLGFAFGALATSIDALWMLSQEYSKRDFVMHVRAYTVLAFAAPMLTGILVYSGQLGQVFLLSFVPALLVMKLPEKLLGAARPKELIPLAALLTTIDAILYTLVITILMTSNR